MSKVNGARRPVVLVVLDGWGYRAERAGNAIAMAQAPTWERLWSRQPKTLLDASGLAVGLPAVHGFLDGRDTLPTSAAGFVRELVGEIRARTGGRGVLSTLTGRYFAMDRD